MAKAPTDRVALLVALIPYVVAEGGVSVADAAAHFDVPQQRIRDAVSLIFMSGVPDGFGDFDRFDLNYDALEQDDVIELSHLPALDGSAIRLAPREASAILAGLTLLSGVHGADEERIEALTTKLRKATIPASPTLAVDTPKADQRMRVVRDAIEHELVIAMDYRKPGSSAETRTVAPTALELLDGEAYIVGFDLDRQAVRRFRLDRAGDIRHVEVAFPGAAREAARPTSIDADETIVVSATPAAAAMLADYAHEPPRVDGDREIVEIRVWNAGEVLRQVASLGGDAIVVRPAHARAAMRRFAEDALMAYASAPHADANSGRGALS